MKKLSTLKKPKPFSIGPHYNLCDMISYIEEKYKIDTSGYTPKCGFTAEQLAEAKQKYGVHDMKPYLDFWHWVIYNKDITNGGTIYLGLFGIYYKGQPKGVKGADWEGDTPERPRWVREIQKMLYDEFKPKDGEMEVWTIW